MKNNSKKGITNLFLLVALLGIFLVGFSSAFSGLGSGTSGDPFQITSWSQLNETRNNLTASYILNANLSSGTAGYAGIGDNWQPITPSLTPFSGSFNGNNFTISNLKIIQPSLDNAGLFGYITTPAIISNVGLVDVNITGYRGVGAIVGFLNTGSSIKNCYSTGILSTTSDYTGGLVGYAKGTINNSYSSVNVTGGLNIGGLVGLLNGGAIQDSFSTGKVSGSGILGGLLGYKSSGTVTNSYWDINTSGQSASADGTGKTTTQMKNISTFSLWNISTTSTNLNNDYPYLAWQTSNSSYVWLIYQNTTSIDTTAPYFTIIPANQSISYGNGLGVQFVATDETAFGTYYLGNWTDKFQINSTGFLSNKTSLSAGTYIINISINDSSGNTNITWYNLTINKATSSVSLTATTPITYGTSTDFAGSNCPSGETCSLNITNGVFKAGIISANYSFAGNENYTASYAIFSVTINKATPFLTKLLNGANNNLTITYPQQVNASGSASVGTLAIYRNNTLITNGDNYSLSAGYYRFDYNITGNENYTDISDSLYATISKNAESCQVYFNLTSPQVEGINFSAWTDCSSAYSLQRNGTVIANNSVQNLTLGAWKFNVSRTDTENYSNIYDEEIFTITSVSDTQNPNVTGLYPSGQLSYLLIGTNTSLNYSISDLSLSTCWLQYNSINTTINCSANSSFIHVSGLNNLTIWANDTSGNINSSILSWSYSSAPVIPPAGGGGGGGSYVNYSDSADNDNEGQIVNQTSVGEIIKEFKDLKPYTWLFILITIIVIIFVIVLAKKYS